MPDKCNATAAAITPPTMTRAIQMLTRGVFCWCSVGSGGGLMYYRMIGCSVTTLMKIETIQKLAKMATF